MNFDKLWDIIVQKNSNLSNDKEVRMTIEGFKKAIKLGYDEGFKAGLKDCHPKYPGSDSIPPIFDQIFGKSRF
jgi:hypothetical protein